jgi:diadenosine tetraphosphate (Ap4A) HIT family hydrolase
VDADRTGRIRADLDAYVRRVQEGPCFVCAFLRGDPDYQHHKLYEDDAAVAFLARYPTLLGYSLVAPKAHIEDWVRDFTADEFVGFQRVVHTVAAAVSATLPTERMYSLSLGSQQGNRHVHWHLAPLPPGVPYREQQFHALMAENGVLAVDDEAQADLARRIRSELSRTTV